MNYKHIAYKIIIVCVIIQLVSCNKTIKTDAIILENRNVLIDTAKKSNSKDLAIKKEAKTEEPFYYNISTRFNPKKKSEILQSITVHNYLSPEESNDVDAIESVEIIKIVNNQESNIRVTNNNQYLSKKQITLLKGLDYSEHYKMNINYKTKNTGSGNFESNRFTFHHTVVPETQAVFTQGNKVFLDFLKANNINFPKAIDFKKLRATKFYFIITKNGNVKNLRIDWSSGYKEIDRQLLDLISKTNGLWNSAKNSTGQFVEQELVLTFGLPSNC